MGSIELFSEVPTIEGERITLRPLQDSDAPALQELMDSAAVYRYLPTYLFEQNHGEAQQVIADCYGELFQDKQSIILGVFLNEDGGFCGLAEVYGYRPEAKKVSIGYRLLERCWGQGIASEACHLLVTYLYDTCDCDLITASTMVENAASAHVLEKNDFIFVTVADEDWGFEEPTPAKKWFC